MALPMGQEGVGVTSMLAFLEKEREREGNAVPNPLPIQTQR